jgi:hypothetical protein
MSARRHPVAVHPAGVERDVPSRILILRSCRLSQFLAAVVLARRRHAQAEIVALSHRGHRQTLRAAGVDRVIEIPGDRFGLLSAPPWTLARVRAGRFDEVVIPQMTDDPEAYANLYRLVLALNPSRVTIFPGDGPAQSYDRAGFMSYVLQHAYGRGFSRWDAAVFIGLAMEFCDRYFLRVR